MKLLGWYANGAAMAVVGAVILVYNAVLWGMGGRSEEGKARRHEATEARSANQVFSPATSFALIAQAWAQLLLDLGCLTLLTLLTGGVHSPLMGFFVFHMVFASLLLPKRMAYAGASISMLMLAAALWSTGTWPVGQRESMLLLAWAVTLLGTVWLANGMTAGLRRQRRRLMRQNRRIRAMSRKLRHQQQAMIQQEKMAASGRMAAGVAHEIANPLASIDGLLQLMERRPDRPRPEAVATLREQVTRISQIVRRMTEFAHPGDGQWQVMPLNDLAAKSLEVIRFDPRLKRVSVDRQFAELMPPVKVLADAVQQVIINLTINALDAMEHVAEPRLTVRTGLAGGHCFVEVEDNGHGISPEHRRRIFEPFFTTKPVGKGTGLGLSISYSLMRKLGGEIRVESKEGQGTRFTVRLPAAGHGVVTAAVDHARTMQGA